MKASVGKRGGLQRAPTRQSAFQTTTPSTVYCITLTQEQSLSKSEMTHFSRQQVSSSRSDGSGAEADNCNWMTLTWLFHAFVQFRSVHCVSPHPPNFVLRCHACLNARLHENTSQHALFSATKTSWIRTPLHGPVP